MSKDRKKEAAMAGVIAYLQMEEQEAKTRCSVAPFQPNAWSMFGRQMMMNDRASMQRRVHNK